MHETPAQRALTLSTAALVVAVTCIAMFVPPFVQHTVASVLRTVALGLMLGAGVLAHWFYLVAAARHQGRPVAAPLAMSVLLFPIGSAAALMLLGARAEDPEHAARAA